MGTLSSTLTTQKRGEIVEQEMLCDVCHEFTEHELYSDTDMCEVWVCKCCDYTVIIFKY